MSRPIVIAWLFVPIIILALVLPASAAVHTLDPGDSVSAAIAASAPDDTIVLNPGTYEETGIEVTKNITIRANTSHGGSSANTIIDAVRAGPILNVSPGIICLFDHLTLANGHSSGDGGAILITSGPVIASVNSTVIRNCSARNGGAIAAANGSHVILNGSRIRDCTAERGGAIANREGSTLFVFDSQIAGCSATYGGAIHDNDGSLSLVIRSEITDSMAVYGGAIFHDNGNTLTIIGSDISRTSAGYGGAVFATNGSAFALLLSNISDSSASFGGAVYDSNRSRFFVSQGLFSNCSAVVSGGAIHMAEGELTAEIKASTFTGCSVPGGTGGAVSLDAIPNFSITTSTFTGCSARDGSAVHSNHSSGTMGYSRLAGNLGTAVSASGGLLAAKENWWGSNSGPGGSTAGAVIAAPWLVLGIIADPSAITTDQASSVRANISYDSDGAVIPGPDFVPDGIPVAFMAGGGKVVPASSSTIAGAAETTFFPRGPGTSLITATVDSQTVSVPVMIAEPSGGDTDYGSPPAFSVTGNVTVPVAGNSAIGGAAVTGTGLSGLILTGIRRDGPGAGIPPVPGIAYQYIRLVPEGYRTVEGAVVSFVVPLVWLAEKRLAPGDILLYRRNGTGWEALPTHPGGNANGSISFTADSPGLADFAIAGSQRAETMTAGVPTPAPSVNMAEPTATATGRSDRTAIHPTTVHPPGTTPAPVPPAVPEGSGSFPLLPVVAVILGMAGVLFGAVIVRRWWIRRQNPALFEK